MPDTSPLHAAADVFLKVSRRMRDLEEQARTALHEHGDEPRYRGLLAEKCELLMHLEDELEHLLPALDPDGRDLVTEKAASLGQRAEQALGLDSVFYMAVLAYPDDYIDGGRDELERFADQLRSF